MKQLNKDSREKRIRTLEILLRDNKETLRQRLEDGTIQEPDEANKLSKKVDKYFMYQDNIRVLSELINKTKREIL